MRMGGSGCHDGRHVQDGMGFFVDVQVHAAPNCASSGRKARSARERLAYHSSHDAPRRSSWRAMHSIGVMPMPPAISTVCAASSFSGK